MWVVVAVVVLGLLTWGGVAIYRRQVYGDVYSESQTTVTVGKGDRFSLAVPAGPAPQPAAILGG